MRGVRELLRKHALFFLLFTLAGLALRLIFLWKLRFIAGDSFIYGDIAKNWMQHGAYAMSESGGLAPTLIRLPDIRCSWWRSGRCSASSTTPR